MAKIDRKAALDYARTYWNRACDDDRIYVRDGFVSVHDKRKPMEARREDGWEAYFVSDGDRGENAVFGRLVGGKLVEQKPDPIVTEKLHLNDCTHYVSRCLKKEGLVIEATGRADELILALEKDHGAASVLAHHAKREQGQKVIESGVFKAGDAIGFYSAKKGRYHHSAMFTGPANSVGDVVGGITCHSVCRFGGLTHDWNAQTSKQNLPDDDHWYIDDDDNVYTLIHFTQDDSPLMAFTLKILSGWWKVGANFYLIRPDGTAKSTPRAPKTKLDAVSHINASAFYFQTDQQVTFVWQRWHGEIQIEAWSLGALSQQALRVDGELGSIQATRVFAPK